MDYEVSGGVQVYVSYSEPDAQFVAALKAAVAAPGLLLTSDDDFDYLHPDGAAAGIDVSIDVADVALIVLGDEVTMQQHEQLLGIEERGLNDELRVVCLQVPGAVPTVINGFDAPVETILLEGFTGAFTASQAEQIRLVLDPSRELGLRRSPVSRRIETLDVGRASRLLGGAEALLAEAEHLLAQEPSQLAQDEIEQLEQDIRIVRAALRSPRPDTVTIERALARIAGTLAGAQPSPAEIVAELELAGLNGTDAAAIADDIDDVTQSVILLGTVDPDADVETARSMQEALGRIEDRLAALAAVSETTAESAPPDPKERIRDAKFRGREKFWSELWPAEKARILGGFVRTGAAISGGVAISLLGIPASILHLAKALITSVFG